jgi:hypothetical protein
MTKSSFASLKRRHGQPEPVRSIVARVMRAIRRGQTRTMPAREELAAIEAASAPLCVVCHASFRAPGWRVCAVCLDEFRDLLAMETA